MDYDIEFGPNVVLRCEHCNSKLLIDEVCWCDDTTVRKGDNPYTHEELEDTKYD